jgi:hypothetical protein
MKKTAVITILALALCATAVVGRGGEEEAELDRLPGADIPVLVHFEKQKLSTVIGAMARTAPFDVTFKDDVGNRLVSVNWEKQSLKQALVKLADEYDLEYDVPSHGHLVVWKRPIQAENAGH